MALAESPRRGGLSLAGRDRNATSEHAPKAHRLMHGSPPSELRVGGCRGACLCANAMAGGAGASPGSNADVQDQQVGQIRCQGTPVHESSDNPDPPAALERDRQTVAWLQAGDPAGLRQLLEDHGGTVRGRLRQRFGKMLDHAELDDVMELASIRAWRSASRFDHSRGSLRGWLSVISRNCALRLLQDRGRSRVELPGDLDLVTSRQPAGAGAGAATGPDRQRLLIDLGQCLEKLPPLQRAVLQADLEAGDSVPAQQLAERFRTTANSIYVSRLKGRRALRAALESRGHFRPEAVRPEDTQSFEAGAEQA